MMDRRVRGLVLISLLAAFCGGLAWAHGQELFAAAFAAAAVVAGFETALRCTGERGSLWMSLDNGLALACEAVRREKEDVLGSLMDRPTFNLQCCLNSRPGHFQ